MIAKSRKSSRIAAAAAALCLTAAAADENYQRSAEQLAKVRSRIEAVSQGIERDRGQQGALRAAVEAAERKIGQAQAEVQRIAGQIDAQESRVRQAQAARAAAQQRLADQKDALARQLRAAYIMGRGGKLETVLSVADPDRIDRMLVYYDALDKARAAAIAGIAREIAQVDALQAQYQAQLDTLRGLKQNRSDALAALQADRAERSQAVAALSARIAGEAGELKGLQANEKQLRDLLEQLRRALADTPVEPGSNKPFPQQHGRLSWPLRGELLARFGDPKAGGRLQWKGVWIAGADGEPVRASARGRVAYVGWLSSYGLIVVLQHEAGYFTLYGHTSSVSRNAGDWVNAGDVIAQAGSTGGYDRSGLYFEVRRGAEPVDPIQWLAR
ncbi:MAG: peptidoglycan DD-metalloendopeptidase family protein [Nevskia sp.]|nr:peptidoglycan DD-metalloendopeptidase family protein [Nevskia sp.]